MAQPITCKFDPQSIGRHRLAGRTPGQCDGGLSIRGETMKQSKYERCILRSFDCRYHNLVQRGVTNNGRITVTCRYCGSTGDRLVSDIESCNELDGRIIFKKT